MKLIEKLKLNEQLKSMKKRLVEIQEQNKQYLIVVDTLMNEINELESSIDLDVSPLGNFSLSIKHDEKNVYFSYAGNMGSGDREVNRMLTNSGWASLDDLRKLNSFEEAGSADYFYEASFLIEEYAETFSKKGKTKN